MSDLLNGKIICFRCITLISLFALIFGLLIIASKSSVNHYQINLLSVWLSVVFMGFIILKLVNSLNAKEGNYLKINDSNIILYKNGKRSASERIENIEFKLASWIADENGPMPAIELMSRKMGQIRIGAYSNEFEWIHYSRIFKKTHYVIEDETQWLKIKSHLINLS